MRYVLFWVGRYQDGTEEGARVYGSVAAALKYAERIKDDVNPHNITVRLFELGKEISIVEVLEEEPQPSKKTIRVRLAGSD